jgi:hypothetical protein
LCIGYTRVCCTMVLVRPLCARPGEGEQRSRTCRRFCLKKRWDTLGEPLSMEHGCHCGVGLSMFLGLQQRHRRGTIFGTSECANNIPSFSSAAFPVDPRIDVSCTLATGTPFGAGERLQRSIYRYRYCDLSDVPPVWHITAPIPTVCLDVISLVVSSCGYNRGQIEQRAAH